MAEKYIKLSDAKKAIEDYRSELTMSKYGSLEACMDAKFAVTGVMKELDYIPAADVVPKSEVEQLKHKYELAVSEREANVKGFTEQFAKAKAEAAREIFEEIDANLRESKDCVSLVRIFKLTKFIAELKKKYTGETK